MNRLLKYATVGALSTTLALASPAFAFRGGGGRGGALCGACGICAGSTLRVPPRLPSPLLPSPLPSLCLLWRTVPLRLLRLLRRLLAQGMDALWAAMGQRLRRLRLLLAARYDRRHWGRGGDRHADVRARKPT